MDVEKSFHMKGGHGNTSYANNSSLQKKGSDMVKHITIETIQDLCQALFAKPSPSTAATGTNAAASDPKKTLITVADMGCSCGPNTLATVRDIYLAVEIASLRTSSNIVTRRSSSPPESDDDCFINHDHDTGGDQYPTAELVVYLNDLPSNDFNSIFKALPDFYDELADLRGRGVLADEDLRGHFGPANLFVSALPGSFYSRLFPCNALHFVYSSYSLHWLSKVPPGIYNEITGESINKGSIYISRNSPMKVIQAYQDQFRDDFSSFLRFRSQELLYQGRMVLIFLGRQGADQIDRGNSFLWELLTRSFHILISQGLVEKERLDSYDVHFYAPSRNEIEEVVRKEGSFVLKRIEMFSIEKDGDYGGAGGVSHGVTVARAVRAIQESMLSHHFGERILNELFRVYARQVDEEMSREAIRPITSVLVLAKA